jgi:hypothetical protein
MRALDRLDCWHEAIHQLTADPRPSSDLAEALLHFWVTHGFRFASSLKGDLVLADALRHLLPLYAGPGLTLYRGELLTRHEARIYGMSWTPKIDVAQIFADRRLHLGEGPGLMLEIDAAPQMIVADRPAHTSWLGEMEYIVDPRMIDRGTVQVRLREPEASQRDSPQTKAETRNKNEQSRALA